MAPVILSVEPVPAITVNHGRPPDWLHWLVRRRGRKLYLLAVNDGDGEGSAAFVLPAGAHAVGELSERRVVRLDSGGFTERFRPLEVRLYEIEPRRNHPPPAK